MAAQSGEGEGQLLARRLLDALDAAQPADWVAFHRAYRDWLLLIARGCLTRNSVLKSEFDCPEELLHAFLVEKVFPPRQALMMFATPARGECPLRPRLATSLRNFCVDVVRALPPVGIWEATEMLEMVEARKEMALPDYEDVTDVLGRQIGVIRECLPVNQGAPYRLALLLRHRLDWAGVFDGIQLRQITGNSAVVLSIATLEQLASWQADEACVRLGESSLSLGDAWEVLKPQLLDAADRRLSSSTVAKVLRVPRDLWDQWVSRGRRRLQQHLGSEYAEAFALWA